MASIKILTEATTQVGDIQHPPQGDWVIIQDRLESRDRGKLSLDRKNASNFVSNFLFARTHTKTQFLAGHHTGANSSFNLSHPGPSPYMASCALSLSELLDESVTFVGFALFMEAAMKVTAFRVLARRWFTRMNSKSLKLMTNVKQGGLQICCTEALA